MFIARLYLVMLSVWCTVWGSLDRLVMWWVRRWYTLYISITNVTRMAQKGIILLVFIIIVIVSTLHLRIELINLMGYDCNDLLIDLRSSPCLCMRIDWVNVLRLPLGLLR